MPNHLPVRAALMLLAVGCGTPVSRGTSAPSTEAVTAVRHQDDVLRRELLARLERDQMARKALMRKQQQGITPDSMDIDRMLTVDTANTAWLRRIVAERGWPGRSLVGSDGASAAFLLVQHADRDTTFQAQVLPLLEQAYAAGEADGQQVALLTDRLAVARGAAQVYGTQAGLIDGRVVVRPIADSAAVDTRRAKVGLPPLAVYVRMLDSLYTARPRR